MTDASMPGVLVNNSGNNNGFNASMEADAERKRRQMVKTYHRYNLKDEENDEVDLDSEKNDLYNKGPLTHTQKIVTNDPTKYLFGISKTNWHPFYNYQNSIDDIRNRYLLITNKDDPYGENDPVTKGDQRTDDSIELFGNKDMTYHQAHDLTLLRRIIKQGPIMTAKCGVLPIIISSIIINIIILLVYLLTTFIPGTAIGWIFGIVNFLFIASLVSKWYTINYSSKIEGITNWNNLKSEIENASNNQPDLNTIETKLKELNKPSAPTGNPPGGNNQATTQQAPPPPPNFTQQIFSGVGSGIGAGISSVIQSFFKPAQENKSN